MANTQGSTDKNLERASSTAHDAVDRATQTASDVCRALRREGRGVARDEGQLGRGRARVRARAPDRGARHRGRRGLRAQHADALARLSPAVREAERAAGRRAPGLGELIGRLLGEARSLVADYAELAVLDARRAAIRLAWLLGAVLIAAVLIVTTWMALVAAGVVFMLGQGASWVTALAGRRACSTWSAPARSAGGCSRSSRNCRSPRCCASCAATLRRSPNDPARPGNLRSREAHRAAPRAAQAPRAATPARARLRALASPVALIAAAGIGFLLANCVRAPQEGAAASRAAQERPHQGGEGDRPRRPRHHRRDVAHARASTARRSGPRKRYSRNSPVEKRRRRLAATRPRRFAPLARLSRR